jgi:hypothetical protein
MPETTSRIEAMSSHQDRGSSSPGDRSRVKPRPKPKALPEAPHVEPTDLPLDDDEDRHKLDTMA